MSTHDPRVVVAVFDGLRPDLVRPDLTPNILRVAERGTWFRNARSIFPSVTRVATTSFATGAPPSVHGIVGNAFYHREALPERVFDTGKASDIRLAEAFHAGRFVTAATFGDQLARAGKRLAVVHTGSAGSAHMINPRAKANGHWTFSVHGVEHTQTPDAVGSVVERIGELPERALPRLPDQAYAAKVMTDHVLPELDPEVALVWFNEPDTTFHYRNIGSEDASRALRAADAALGAILDWIEARPDVDRYSVIVASDHGQISTGSVVPMAEQAREAGFGIAHKDSLSGAGFVMTGGRNAEIRRLEAGREDLERLAFWLMEHPAVGHVFSRGRNGVDGEIPGTLAFDVVANHHPRQPDLAFVLKADGRPDDHGLPGLGAMTPGDVPLGGGMHGGLHEGELNTVLVVSVPDRVPAGEVSPLPAGLIDIGPTVLDLLGVGKAASMQGRSLVRQVDGEPVVRSHSAGRAGFSQTVEVVEHAGRTFILRG